jgi:hypothetical protein
LNSAKNSERDRPDRGFAKFYHVVIMYVWGYLPPTAKEVYPILLRFADYNTRKATVHQARIGELARKRPMKQPEVSRTIRKYLEPWGLVKVKKYQDQYGCWQTHYYLPREDEIVEHLVKNGLIQDEVADQFVREYGGQSGDKPRETPEVLEEVSNEEQLRKIDELNASINEDIGDIY